jgi:type I restriction enzyme S subunit
MTKHEAPAQWSKRRLRFDARINPLKSKLDLPLDTEVSFVPMDAVGELGGLQLNETRLLEEVYNGYTYFSDGDVCIAKITPCFENGKGALAKGLANGVAFGTTELHVIRPLTGLDARFLFYLTIAHDFRSFGAAEMLGAGGQKRVPEEFLKDWRAPLPPLETQRRIARFLDEKTARIDELIEKKHALLDRLAENRQALITRAVTTGLNPTAPMRPSGIDWLGDIPAHWEVKRLRYAVKNLNNMRVPIAAELRKGIDRTYPYYGASGIIDYVDEYIFDFATVLVAEDGANLLSRSTPLSFVADGKYWVNNHAHILKPEAMTIWFCSSILAMYPLDPYISGSAQPKLTKDNLSALPVWVPPLDEQQEIEEGIARQTGELTDAAKPLQESIKKLEEYRAALVTSAVTGKLEGLQ